MRSKKPADTAHFSVMIDVSEEEGMSEGVDERPGESEGLEISASKLFHMRPFIC